MSKLKYEKEFVARLMKLNNHMYESKISENDQVNVILASILCMQNVGEVHMLSEKELISSLELDKTDGNIMLSRVELFLNKKDVKINTKSMILKLFKTTLLSEQMNEINNDNSRLKDLYIKVTNELSDYFKLGLNLDITGMVFNAMYSWIGFSKNELNDIVLTPSYVSELLAKLSRVNRDSRVVDLAMGSGSLLIGGINEMLNDAKNVINSSEELADKEYTIKNKQLLGIELSPIIHMLGALNMIMVSDGDMSILNGDSLNEFDGIMNDFKPDRFILNPPYSVEGNGMIFVEKALSMMDTGYGAVIIQNSAGSGKAIEINKRILENNTLMASIKMPVDIFIGKASVQTNIYVFKVGEGHHKDEVVKFIDFSNDGYKRTNRKKSTDNLKDTGNARERYEEVVNLVRFGRTKLKIFTDKEYYEGHIDPTNGADWNQSAPIDTTPTIDDFKKTISDYLAWEITNILKGTNDLGK